VADLPKLFGKGPLATGAFIVVAGLFGQDGRGGLVLAFSKGTFPLPYLEGRLFRDLLAKVRT